MNLAGRRALITGSTSGIGLGIARVLAEAGCSVMLNGFGEPSQIESLRAELHRGSGCESCYDPADLSTAEGCRGLVAHSIDKLGGLDIVVNNAGIQYVAPVEDFPAEQWDRILAINLSAAFHVIAAAVPAMRTAGWGRIVNVASVHGLVASVNKSAYVAAKHGLVGLTKVVALELAREPITCNAICPGFVLTPLIERQIEAKAQELGMPREVAVRELLKEKQPSMRFTQVEEIGALVVFLCSNAAANITGASLPVDGGWTAQ
ncbi:MAG: 3-hydroxybutyrate dehydrogenase [Acidobacteriota bacterium]|nr:3-hydroxybutyrate dehydrogenase [Acidobacteriota bacterium]